MPVWQRAPRSLWPREHVWWGNNFSLFFAQAALLWRITPRKVICLPGSELNVGRIMMIFVGAGWAHEGTFLDIVCYSQLWSVLSNTWISSNQECFWRGCSLYWFWLHDLEQIMKARASYFIFLVHFQVASINCLTFQGVKHLQGNTLML